MSLLAADQMKWNELSRKYWLEVAESVAEGSWFLSLKPPKENEKEKKYAFEGEKDLIRMMIRNSIAEDKFFKQKL